MATRVVVGKAAQAVGKAIKKAPRKRRALRAPLSITTNAAQQVKDILSTNEDALGVRLGVKTRGCNGLSYTLNFVEEFNKMDEIVEEHGIKVCIEPKALFHIIGTTMDYEETAIASQFVFVNPNATGACGCGESFSVGDDPTPGMPGGPAGAPGTL